MPEGFRQPAVFGAGYRAESRPSKGRVVEVANLDEIPYPLREKIPALAQARADGYVVKRYRSNQEQVSAERSFLGLEELSQEEDILYFEETCKATGESFPLSTHTRAELTIIDQVVLLKERQKQLDRYLADVLPNAVVKSEFLVAQDDQQEFSLYEIQEKISDYVDLETIGDAHIKQFSQEAKQRLRTQLEGLIEKPQALARDKNHPYYKYFLPDLNQTNIAITSQGGIKLFDTNVCELRSATMGVLLLLTTNERLRRLLKTLS